MENNRRFHHYCRVRAAFASAAAICLLLCAVLPCSAIAAAPRVLKGHLPAWVNRAADAGPAARDLQLNNLFLVLKRPAAQEQQFRDFLARQQDPDSPDYHRWLTSRQVGQRFGVPAGNIETVSNWLRYHGLHIDGVSNSRMLIRFSGSSAAVASAFSSEFHYYRPRISGSGAQPRLSIDTEPAVPDSIAPFVAAVSGLSQMPVRPMLHSRILAESSLPSFRNCSSPVCNYFISPADFATIFDIAPLYNSGINGSGETIAIVGRSRVADTDIQDFAQNTGLTLQSPTVIVPPDGTDPGTTGDGNQSEATVDVERALGTAPGASVDLIVSASSKTEDGVTIALIYAIDTKQDPILSDSFGVCESSGGAASATAWDQIAAQAAAEGISFFAISGDSGAAGCDQPFSAPPATQTASPNLACVSGYVTCVGGTEFNDAINPLPYWSAVSSPSENSALGYIPEGAWNEPTNTSGGYQIAATGGGPSAFILKPSWQAGDGVPDDGHRDTPDIAFPSSGHDAYYACIAYSGADCSTGHFASIYGTSAAGPSMAGIAALIDQRLGTPQGNLNPALYRLAATTPGAFHDVTVFTSGVGECSLDTPSMCNNSTPSATALTGGLTGYAVGPGYDLVTGLGSIDVTNLIDVLAGIQPSFALASSGSITVAPGATVSNAASITVTSSGGFTGTVSLSCAITSTPSGAQYLPTCSIPGSVAVSGTTPAAINVTVLTTTPIASTRLVPDAVSVFACACLFVMPRRRRARLALIGLFLFAVMLVSLGCGNGGGSAPQTVSYSSPGTPPGAYVVTVTGTSGSITATTTVPVTVS